MHWQAEYIEPTQPVLQIPLSLSHAASSKTGPSWGLCSLWTGLTVLCAPGPPEGVNSRTHGGVSPTTGQPPGWDLQPGPHSLLPAHVPLRDVILPAPASPSASSCVRARDTHSLGSRHRALYIRSKARFCIQLSQVFSDYFILSNSVLQKVSSLKLGY